MLANVVDGIVTADEGGLIESFNRSARRLFGYTEEEVIGQPLALIIAPSHHDDLSALMAATRRLRARNEPSRGADRDGRLPQGRLVLPDGD